MFASRNLKLVRPEVRIDGGECDTANALEVPGCRSVPVLHVEVDGRQGDKEEKKPGKSIHCHCQGADHPEEVGQEDVEDEWEAVVHCGEIAGEPVEDLPDWSRVKEDNLPPHNTFQKLLMNGPSRNDTSKSKEERSHEGEKRVCNGNGTVDCEVISNCCCLRVAVMASKIDIEHCVKRDVGL